MNMLLDTPFLTEIHLTNCVGLVDDSRPLVSIFTQLKELKTLRIQRTTYLQPDEVVQIINTCCHLTWFAFTPVWKRIRKSTNEWIQKKVQVGKDQEMAQSEKDSHSKNRGGKKTNQQSGTYTMKHIVSRMSSYFPNRWQVFNSKPDPIFGACSLELNIHTCQICSILCIKSLQNGRELDRPSETDSDYY